MNQKTHGEFLKRMNIYYYVFCLILGLWSCSSRFMFAYMDSPNTTMQLVSTITFFASLALVVGFLAYFIKCYNDRIRSDGNKIHMLQKTISSLEYNQTTNRFDRSKEPKYIVQGKELVKPECPVCHKDIGVLVTKFLFPQRPFLFSTETQTYHEGRSGYNMIMCPHCESRTRISDEDQPFKLLEEWNNGRFIIINSNKEQNKDSSDAGKTK